MNQQTTIRKINEWKDGDDEDELKIALIIAMATMWETKSMMTLLVCSTTLRDKNFNSRSKFCGLTRYSPERTLDHSCTCTTWNSLLWMEYSPTASPNLRKGPEKYNMPFHPEVGNAKLLGTSKPYIVYKPLRV
jgi:hypothetical protein